MILPLYLLTTALLVTSSALDTTPLPTGSDRISALDLTSKGGSMGSTVAGGAPKKLSRSMEMRSKFGPKDYISDLDNLKPAFKTPYGTYQALTMVEFPALEGNKIAMAKLVLEPCGLMVTFFPMGLVHYVHNLGCEKAEFLIAYNSEDPGLYIFVKMFEDLPLDALGAIFDLPEDKIKNLKSGIAAGPFVASKECQKKCAKKDDKDGKKKDEVDVDY